MSSWHIRVMTSAATTSLRERQAHLARTAILEAAISHLETTGVDEVSMAQIAESSGVSLRTLYRYFPDRADLLQAAGEHVYTSLGVPFEVSGPEQISASLLDAARRLSARPELTRALVRTTAGRAARSAVRSQRVAAITSALEPVTSELDPDTARWATAVIAHLCSAASWVIIAEESRLDDSDAQHAVAWAIDRLVSCLQETPQTSEPTPPPSSAPATQPEEIP
jgi:AcrR family transcriptional regulator